MTRKEPNTFLQRQSGDLPLMLLLMFMANLQKAGIYTHHAGCVHSIRC